MASDYTLQGRIFLGLFTTAVLLFGGGSILQQGCDEPGGSSQAIGVILLAAALFRAVKVYLDVQTHRRRSSKPPLR